MTTHDDRTALAEAHEHGGSTLLGDQGASLAEAARRGRVADGELAAALNRPPPAGAAATAGYLDQLGRRPVLPESLERELVQAAQAGDAAARARLVEAFIPLIASVARIYRDSPRLDRVELLQEGVVGLLRALERYDPDRRTPFWAYAAYWVRQAMQQLVAELTRPLVLSDRALRHLARLREAHRDALRENRREPSAHELADRSGLSAEQVEHLLSVDSPARSIDEEVAGADGAVGTFGDLLADPMAEGDYERVLEAIEQEELLALLAGLSDRERTVLRARYGLDDNEEESLRSIGSRLGISAERVRQIEERALAKLAAAASP